MTGMYSVQIASGLAVQQQYQATALSSLRPSDGRARSGTRLTEDTVDISPQAYELFHAQKVNSTIESMTSAETERQDAGTNSRTTEAQNMAEPSQRSNVSDRLEEVETQISNLEAEITSLEETAQTDDIAAGLLRSKQARLKTLEAMLTGLFAKFMFPS